MNIKNINFEEEYKKLEQVKENIFEHQFEGKIKYNKNIVEEIEITYDNKIYSLIGNNEIEKESKYPNYINIYGVIINMFNNLKFIDCFDIYFKQLTTDDKYVKEKEYQTNVIYEVICLSFVINENIEIIINLYAK